MADLAQHLARYNAAVKELAAAKAALDVATEALMPPAARPDVRLVQETVANHFTLPVHVLWSPARHEPVATARNLAFALASEITQCDEMELSAAFKRQRSTAYHAFRTVAARRETERTIDALYNFLRARCVHALE